MTEHNLYGGDIILTFDPGPHVYRVKNTGVPVISTTTVTRIIAKEALKLWAVAETVKYLDLHWDPRRKYTPQAKKALLKAAKRSYKNISEEALSVGSEVHGWIENFCRAKMAGKDTADLPKSGQANSACQAFVEWFQEHDVEILAVEKKVYSKKYGYSGTYDIKANVDGLLTLIDIKTSSAIWPEYFLQLAAYVQADEEEQQYLVDTNRKTEVEHYERGMIVRVPKDGSSFEVQSTVLLDDLFEAFSACLVLQQWKHSEPGTLFDKNRREVLESRDVRPKLSARYSEQDVYQQELDDEVWEKAIELYGLSLEDQRAIKEKHVPRKYSPAKLANEYGVTAYKIRKILERDLDQILHKIKHNIKL